MSLTLDLWSNRQMRGFLGITCHFIVNWSLESAMLECKRFKGRHTAENIAQYYDEAITSYGIHSKIVTTVTDNASNVVKAMSLPGFEECELSDAEEEDDDGDSSEDESVEEFGDLESDSSGNPQVVLASQGSQHDTCFAHTLQLVVKDGFKQIGAVKKVLAKVPTIVSYVRKSQIATELLEGERKLQRKNATRWNSEVKSIKSILKVPEDKLKLLDAPQLTVYDRKILQDMVTVLYPFQEATDLTQGENVVTASFAIPCIRGLRQSLQSLSVTYNSRMVHALQDSLDKRMSKYEEREIFILASILDPRFKMKWCRDDDEKNISKALLIRHADTQFQL